jgi:hypothetical protein
MDLCKEKHLAMMKTEKKYTVPKPRGMKVEKKEAEILLECKDYLETREDIFWRRVEGAGKFVAGKFVKSDMKGCPDLMILCQGRLYLAELKVAGGSLSEGQADFILGSGRHGAVGGVVCSREALKRFLGDQAQDAQMTTDRGAIAIWY